MKIIHIIPNLKKGGAERLVVDAVRELSLRKGVEVSLVVFRDEIEYDIENLKELIHIIPSTSKLSIWKNNRFQLDELQQFITAFQPEIIHSHLFEAEIVSRSCKYPKAKWFSHFHDNMAQLNKLSLSKLFSKITWTQFYEKQYLLKQYSKNGGNQFIAISKNTKKYVAQVLPKKSIVYYLNNAINFSNFFSKVTPIYQDRPLQLINVGSFQKLKNQQFLFQIVSHLKKQNIKVELSLLGDGAERENLKLKVKELDIEAQVFFRGNVQNVPQYLSKADVYVHSSYSEAFGLVLLEAMAAGLPVITLNGGGNVDLIQHQKNGYLFDEQDVNLFTKCIQELMDNKDKYLDIAKTGQDFAKNYDISSYIDKLLDLYGTAINE